MSAVAGEQLVLESALRRAVERQELLLEYQPSVNVATGKLSGVEALVRWRHPDLGLLQPDDFIPLADESGLIAEIGKWVLQNACRQAKAWHDAGHPGLAITVNLSPVQFWQHGLAQTVAEVLADTGIAPERVELGITESMLMRDAEGTIATLQTLKNMQVKISVYDFGTGYSSLSYLKRYPVDILKIDKSFSRDGIRNVETEAIIQAIGALGRSLGLLTVAGGVETAEQLKFFHQQRYDRAQGLLFSAPRAAADITAMLSACSGEQLLPPIIGAQDRDITDCVGQIPTQ
jgi:EAL domain-containing protein (putative c-di-GMP-specific phosphodiesterase class I)